MLSNSHVILNGSEGSQRPNMRFFLPVGRQNDKMIVCFHFETPTFFEARNARISRNNTVYFSHPIVGASFMGALFVVQNVGTRRALSEEFRPQISQIIKDFNLCESVQSVVCTIFGRADPAPTAITGTVTMTKRADT